MMPEILTCSLTQWSPKLGDAHVMGWVTVGVYLLAAAAAARKGLLGPFPAASRRREQAFWSMAAMLLLLLAINKQLDLQSLLTALARCTAQAQGWYEDRQIIQRWFILAVIVGGTASLVALGALMRGTLARTGIALLGLGFVSLFVAVRAAGFHHMDALINSWLAGVRLNWALELPGPGLVLLAALRGSLPIRP